VTRSRSSTGGVTGLCIAVLLALPAFVLCPRDDALYTPLWQADPWFYFGFFRDFINFKRDLFPDSYYGSRLSWIVPGFVVHSFFSPLLANAVLHLTVHSIAVLSLFFVLRRTIGIRSAYLAAMIFSLHPWLWAATGWDHVNGGAIAYLLLASALLTAAAMGGLKKLCLIAAGMAIAGAVFAHLFLIAFVPLLVAYYIGLQGSRNLDGVKRSLVAMAPWTIGGFLAITVPLCAINYAVDRNPWFWSPSLRTAQNVAQNYSWTESIWSDNSLVPWLWFIVAGGAVAITAIVRAWKAVKRDWCAASVLFSGQLVLALGLMIALQLAGITLLGHYYYACYLLPFVFLVIGATVARPVEALPVRVYFVIAILSTFLFGGLWYEPVASALQRIPGSLEILAAAIVLAGALSIRSGMSGVVAALVALGLLTSAVYTGMYRLVPLHGTRAEYLRTVRAREFVEQERGDAPIRFWYDKREPGYFEYFALNATYMAEFSRINEEFPKGCTSAVDPRTRIVVLSDQDRIEQTALTALDDCWQSYGTRAAVDRVETLQSGKGPYRMAILRVEPAPVQPPDGDTLLSIPLTQLQLGDSHASIERWQEGMSVTTPPGFGAFAARTPLGVDTARGEHLVVWVKARVFAGEVGIGILDSQQKTLLTERTMWPLPAATAVTLTLPSRQAVGDLVIMNRMIDSRVSDILVEGIEIRKLP